MKIRFNCVEKYLCGCDSQNEELDLNRCKCLNMMAVRYTTHCVPNECGCHIGWENALKSLSAHIFHSLSLSLFHFKNMKPKIECGFGIVLFSLNLNLI